MSSLPELRDLSSRAKYNSKSGIISRGACQSRHKKEILGRGIDNAVPFWGVPEYSIIERAIAKPTCDVNGIFGGYTGAGVKTLIPSQAGFKVSMRLVEDQDPEDILERLGAFIKGFESDTAKIEYKAGQGCTPCALVSTGPAMDALMQAYGEVVGKVPELCGEGGSVPITGMCKKILGLPVVNVGLSDGDNVHSPNEYMNLDSVPKGVALLINAYFNLSELKKKEMI